MNASCIKPIKSTYNACKGSKTVHKKGMNEYLEAEKEAGTYATTESVVEIAEEPSVRKSCQAVAKRTHPSSEGCSSQKKARRKPEAEVPLQRDSQSGLGPTKSEQEEEEVALRSFKVSTVKALLLQKG